ncbi:MAG: iron-sulfur cluster assembly scaffold protein [archaeon]|nr:MAG: iron-sulfur cluster assembly scaffold protein [archaeon]
MALEYNKKVMQYFLNPKNVGEIKNPDGVGKVGNLTCGDVMWLFVKIEKDKIKDIKFKTLGCAAAIATSSIITELAKGKTIKDALKLSNKDVVKALGSLPVIKHHCSLLAEEALCEAIYDYLRKKKRPIPKFLEKKHQKIKKAGNVCK